VSQKTRKLNKKLDKIREVTTCSVSGRETYTYHTDYFSSYLKLTEKYYPVSGSSKMPINTTLSLVAFILFPFVTAYLGYLLRTVLRFEHPSPFSEPKFEISGEEFSSCLTAGIFAETPIMWTIVAIVYFL
jgi:hypothetical protein